MELATQALHPARQAGHLRIQLSVGEIDMRPGQPALAQVFRQCLQHQQRIGRVHRQQARPADGAERHGAEQLGVIGDAGALAGIGPTVIEHVLAIRMPFAISRQQRTHLPVTLEHQVFGCPASVGRNAATVFHGTEKGMAQERLARRDQGIPGRRWQVTQMGKAVETGHVFDSLFKAISIGEQRPVAQMMSGPFRLSCSIT